MPLDDSDYGFAAQDLKLAKMSHSELYLERMKVGANQDKLAPYEHRAYAREFAETRPVVAAMSLPIAIPAYTAAKALGIQKARSGASIEEMKQGFKGMMEGLFPRQKSGEQERMGVRGTLMDKPARQRPMRKYSGGVRG